MLPKLKAPSLGERLLSLLKLIEEAQKECRYDAIWDCCCDHGYLGINILHQQLSEQVIFVDQVPGILEQLKPRLESYSSHRYQLITQDVGRLEFASDIRHLVIIAGVGGENTVAMLQAIECRHPEADIDYLFCPATSQYQLREHLARQGYSLAYEALVTENNRDYEVIYVQQPKSSTAFMPVSLTGVMWRRQQATHYRYLQKLITHYQNQSRTDQSGRKREIMALYQQQLEEIA